jgi:hypothetical protein
MEEKLDRILDILTDTVDRIISIECQLTELKEISQNNEIVCDKMSNHIDFIERTYSKLRTPLDYIRGKFYSSSGSLEELEE